MISPSSRSVGFPSSSLLDSLGSDGEELEGRIEIELETIRGEIEGVERTDGEATDPAQRQALMQSAFLAATAEDKTPEGRRDALSTRMMEIFRLYRSRASFGLLYELNRQHLYFQVASRLRRYASRAEPHDILQEVFVNVYRYPHRFDCTREDAFRVWSATIVRNTVLKHLRSLSRSGRAEMPFEDLPEPQEPRGDSPLGDALEKEGEQECAKVYLTYLHLYLRFYSMLSERERSAIHLVEVEERSYREASLELGIKLENLKMVIFRARRKIHRSMRRVFEGLPAECRPARDPAPGRNRASVLSGSPGASRLESAEGLEKENS